MSAKREVALSFLNRSIRRALAFDHPWIVRPAVQKAAKRVVALVARGARPRRVRRAEAKLQRVKDASAKREAP